MEMFGKERIIAWVYLSILRICMKGCRTSVWVPREITNNFYVGMGLHQGSALNPFLFTLVMDEFAKGIQDELPGVCYLQITLFLLMRTEREFVISWSDGDIH